LIEEDIPLRKSMLLLAAFSLSAPVLAQGVAQTGAGGVSMSSTVQAVKVITDAKGVKKNTLVTPTTVLPGTPLVVSITYKNGGSKPVTGFVINNPVAPGMDFTAVAENWAVVSIDNGKTFGALGTLKVKMPDGKMRGAIPQDVTAVRWTLPQPLAPGASGKVTFYAVVK
jgi:hypothetical protein